MEERRAGKSIRGAMEFLSVIREGSENVIYIGKDVVAVPTKKYQQLEAENKELKESLRKIKNYDYGYYTAILNNELPEPPKEV